MRTIIVIPARIGSTRFPGKVLAPILGKPMIHYVYDGARESKIVEKVLVATDSSEVLEVVKGFGGEAILTPSELPSGTDRVYAAVRDLSAKYIVNLQGDEPLIRGTVLDTIFEVLFDTDADIVTPYYKTRDKREINDPNRIKIVSDKRDYALYFSRSPIPFERDANSTIRYKIHTGIYGFKRESLERFVSLPQSELEKTEKLEQLRALENGMKIKLVEVDFKSIPVDVPEDIKKIEKLLTKSSK
ncbi:MAG TPA: 3-deoxy-manno-octulosonate cytidylyltransferase [Candidatus Hydrothermia bacterium]|nr:3-deoxy-manno-octulosonate cytidylyltransferase [Candidatus Hydrothermia bacterium]HOL23233.1 3-deoxy-manno-octulosonate cytidylyltransferase [Candidatus Hydrothermia bacterium]HOP32581.1 3-deoxy-manno-octulosonate cytidylyltransferase [Candidatus Hydrothermia bacterium]HPO78243.1 3-deoxy-manno-octulosonate cytidylyltransferase [Candidatus Hydrothermia bacterium]HRD22552.1 3-deoxy-manno-octulosonate cytidylyltransferase [Candidatus Hydrothermia bacterium]